MIVPAAPGRRRHRPLARQGPLKFYAACFGELDGKKLNLFHLYCLVEGARS